MFYNIFLFIYNINGVLCYYETIQDSKKVDKQFDLSSLNQGIYIVKIIAGNNSESLKIIKVN